eukprot:COSAG05_NODE_3122_length_2308_cov_1.486646_1_plen_138_part_10
MVESVQKFGLPVGQSVEGERYEYGRVKDVVKFELLYRASEDGWEATKFHECCDNKGATVVLVKTSRGHIFGGYADASWRGFGERNISPSPGGAFLFTLRNATGMPPTKMPKLAACKQCCQRFGSGSRLRNAGRRGFPG